MIFLVIFNCKINKMSSNNECPICVSTYNKSTCKEVSCPYCSYTICSKCMKRSIIDSLSCMNCKHEWNNDFVRNNTPKTWFDKEYKEHRKNMLFEREKMLLQTAIPFLKERQVEKRYKKQI